MADVIRIEFGSEERPLKARHRQLREAVRQSGKSISELLGDPFGGWPFLLQALVNAKTVQAISLDKASDLIDAYRDKHHSIKGLADALGKLLGDYVNIEATPSDEEEADAEARDTVPKGDGPVGMARSID